MGGRGARGVGKGKGGKATSPSKYKGSLSNFGSKRIFLSYKNNSSRWERNMHVVGSNSGMKGLDKNKGLKVHLELKEEVVKEFLGSYTIVTLILV